MTPYQFYKTHTEEEVKALCQKAKTKPSNFRLIALYNGAVSRKLARRLALASDGDMTEMEILYPQPAEQPVTNATTAA